MPPSAVRPNPPSAAVQLDRALFEVRQMAAQATGTMTSGPFDRPGPQRDVFAGEFHSSA